MLRTSNRVSEARRLDVHPWCCSGIDRGSDSGTDLAGVPEWAVGSFSNIVLTMHILSDFIVTWMLADADIMTLFALGLAGGALAWATGYVYRWSIKVFSVSVGD